MRVLLLILLVGCVEARSGAGAECARNSQCAAPLVCELQRCRVECNTTRDCPVGSVCLIADSFGVCRLPEESTCMEASCPEPLVCRDGCTHSCPCAPGASCIEDVCVDLSNARCETNLDCVDGLICLDGLCLEACRSDRDCRFGSSCQDGFCRTSADAGVDAGVDAAIDVPVDVPVSPTLCDPGVVPVVNVSVGERHACAALADGSVYCWGGNSAGELGNELLEARTVSTGFRASVDDVARVIAGHSHTLALHRDGTASCWGDSRRGQCGVGPVNFTPPMSVSGLASIDALAAGEFATCALVENTVWCMGEQTDGALANGETGGQSDVPVVATELPSARALDYRTSGGVLIGVDGTLTTWGSPFGTPRTGEPVPAYEPPSFTDTIQLALGQEHLCLLRETGEVHCAGDNTFGQLGDPGRGASDLSFASVGLANIVQITASDESMCARDDDGAVWCWGRNTSGSLGVGDGMGRTTPTMLELPGAATDVSLWNRNGCAVVDGHAYCWGAPEVVGFAPATGTTEPTRPVECLP